MTQNKTNSAVRIKLLFVVAFLSLSACAPKKSGVRAQVKTGQTSLNSGISAIAEQQAAAQNAIYKISTISLPKPTDLGVIVESELLNPTHQYLPVTTTHENGVLDSQGVFNDSGRGLQVQVRARCSDTDCYKYLLLVTVSRNNQPLFQSGAISFKDDCNFYSISMGTATGQMFQSIDAFDTKYSNLTPMGDSNSCLE
jgi:hypothetical protein